MRTPALLCLAASFLVAGAPFRQDEVPPPRPLLPIPTGRQLDWQRKEMAMFLHFGVNTFSGREWGTGDEDPNSFNPSRLDAAQWARVARETGFRTLILTAKHHDGFAIWPSRYTEHTVKNASWGNGRGDVVRELAEAARAEGLDLGLYLSPWDRHEPSYGDERAYNEFYIGQLRELLTEYGPLAEVWFDGAKGPEAVDMDYDFAAYWSLVRQLQPGAVIFSDEGPDVRWIGNEHGFAGATNWSTIDRSRVEVGNAEADYLNSGDPEGSDWVPGECDVSIRRGWFWHEDEEPKSLDVLLDIYFKSVGRNCVLLLNVPPDREGRLDPADVERLYELRAALDAIFATDLAAIGRAAASSVRGGSAGYEASHVLDGDLETYWATDDSVTRATLEVDLGARATFNVVRIQEPIQLGQRVSAYRIEVEQDDGWETVSSGTTIGHKKLDRIETVTARRIRLIIDEVRAHPLIAELGLHLHRGR
ncbi:MAG: alpha-L-fucosidase [Gemmatimonadota bacterium]|nr:MAG: alpha-L-fucosidase [Gemmatimonadota bacterium]